MAVVKQEYLNKTYQALINNQSNAYAQRRRFMSTNYGDNTPIDAKALDNLPNGKVILTQEVFEQLLKVNDESEKARAEFSYLLTGITEGNTVKFDNIVWCRNQGSSREADFTPLIPKLNAYVNAVRQTGETQAVVCNGHTHPKALSCYDRKISRTDISNRIINSSRTTRPLSFRESLRKGAPSQAEQAQFSAQARRRAALQRELGNMQNFDGSRE